MIAVLVCKEDNVAGLRKDFDAFVQHYGHPPALIVSHDNLVYDLSDEELIANNTPDDTSVSFRGVTVLDLDHFISLLDSDLSDRNGGDDLDDDGGED